MNSTKPFGGIIGIIYPLLSLIIFVVIVATLFGTFDLAIDVAAYNIVIALPIISICFMLIRRFHIATCFSAAVVFALFYLDQYVVASRLTHIRYSDFKLFTQAIRVADRYALPWNASIIMKVAIVIALCILLIIIYRFYNLHYHNRSVFIFGLILFAGSIGIIYSGIIPSEKEGFDFFSDAEQRGLLYSWYCQASESGIQKPAGYSRNEAKRILAQYNKRIGEDDVNIIAIMNESLSDYSLIGTPCFDDPLPYIHSLGKNSFEGKLIVDVFGGGTANTEYSFLTGNSFAFLPKDVTPYLQYIDGEEDSIVQDLADLDYKNIAIHPYFSEEWNRTQVYASFGFEKYISGIDFGNGIYGNGKSITSVVPDNVLNFGQGPLYIRGLISDQTNYECILDETGERSFIFDVTIQNHGGYDYVGNDFESKVYVEPEDRREWDGQLSLNGFLYNIGSENIGEEVSKVNQYLTCANYSDQAFRYLIEELKKVDEKTIVLMFGDHQPGLLISEHYVDTKESEDPDYTVPYVLWANYDIEFDAPEYTSPNYLSAILKKNAGMSLTSWDQFRLDMMEEYPVVTSNYILDEDGNCVSRELLKDYEIVQYMRAFDR